MNAVFIGSSGHMNYAFPAIIKYGIYVAGCAVTDGEDGNALSKRLSEVFGYTVPLMTIGELFDLEPDYAVVNTVFSRNSAIAAEALRRRINVLLEKPAATDLCGLDELRRAYYTPDRRRRPLLCGMFGIRCESPFVTAKRLAQSGALGDIRLLNGMKSYKMGSRPWFYRSRETYGGIIPWVAIHAFDWITWIGGKAVTGVSALHSSAFNRGNGDMEVSSIINFTLDGGGMASVTADMLRPDCAPTHGDDRLRVVGTDGTLEVRHGKVFLNDAEIDSLDSPVDLFESMHLSLTENLPCITNAEDLFDATYSALMARKSADEGGTFYRF